MARTLSHIVDPNATKTDTAKLARDQEYILTQVWSATLALWRLGRRHAQLTAGLAKLEAQLDRPDAASRDGYSAALERAVGWGVELEGIDEMQALPLIESLATHYGRLSTRRRQELIAHDGWSWNLNPQGFGEEMWQKAKQRQAYPSGEPPFIRVASEFFGELFWHEETREDAA